MREYVRGEFSVTQCLEVSHGVQMIRGSGGYTGVYTGLIEGRVRGEGEGYLINGILRRYVWWRVYGRSEVIVGEEDFMAFGEI